MTDWFALACHITGSAQRGCDSNPQPHTGPEQSHEHRSTYERLGDLDRRLRSLSDADLTAELYQRQIETQP